MSKGSCQDAEEGSTEPSLACGLLGTGLQEGLGGAQPEP